MLHLVARRVLKQHSSGGLAYIVTVVPGSALQNATTFIANVTVHHPDSVALVTAAFGNLMMISSMHFSNPFAAVHSVICLLAVHAACHASMAHYSCMLTHSFGVLLLAGSYVQGI
jgi:hypothetical protein